MNKKVTRIIFVLILLMSICLAANAQSAGYIGSWRLTGIEGDGYTMSAEELEASFIMIFREDGIAEMGEDEDALYPLEWKMKDGVVQIEEEDELFICILTGDTMKVTSSFGTMVFGRDSAVPSVKKDIPSVEEDDASNDGLVIELPADLIPSQDANIPSALKPSDVIGAWTIIAIETEGVSLPTDVDFVILLNEDYSSDLLLYGQGAEKPGTWSIKDGNVYLLASGGDSPVAYTLIDGNLVVEENGTKMIFEKSEGQKQEAAGLPDLIPSQEVNTPAALEPGDVIGTWTLYATETNGMLVEEGMDLVMQLNEDYSSYASSYGIGADKPGTWSITEGKLSVFASGQDTPLVYTLIDGDLVTAVGESKFMLRKTEGPKQEATDQPDLIPSQRTDTPDVLGPDDFIGAWTLNAQEAGGVTQATDVDMVMQLNEDHSAMMIWSGQEPDKPGSWTIIDGKIHLLAAGSNSPLVFTPIDGNLVAGEDGMRMIFGKAEGQNQEAAGQPELIPSQRADTPAALKPGDVIGAWVLDTMENDKQEVSDVSMFNLIIRLDEDYSVYYLRDTGEEADKPGTWAIKDGSIHTLSGTDNLMVFTLDGENLIFPMDDGYRMILRKARQNETEAPDLPAAPGRTEDSGNQPVIASGGPTRLKNYEEWLKPYVDRMPMDNMLDRWISTTDAGYNLVQDAIEYPRAWPAELLGGAIPEYTGEGWLYDLFVTHPNMSYAAKDISYLAVTIYEHSEDDLSAYIGSLASYGYGEVFSGEYYDAIISQFKAFGGDTVRCFENENNFVSLMTGHGEGGHFRIGFSEDFDDLPFLNISVNCLGRRSFYTLNEAATPGTKLLNFEQAGRPGGIAAGYGTDMNNIVETSTDQYGRFNTTQLLPSSWPAEIFGELIPEYVSAGVLGLLYITDPEEDADIGQTLLATLYILDYQSDDVDRYIETVKAFGYRELPVSDYADSQVAAAAQSNRYQVFKLPGVMLAITESTYKGNDELSIGLSWEGRTRNYFTSQGY